jgi:regulator of nucleoside diphosphate kinase
MSRADHERLTRLAGSLSNSSPDLADDLFGELDRARVVDSLERRPEIVRMGSTLRFTTDSGEERTVKLVFPAEADIAEGKVSVLTPIGIALIGLAAGQSMDWTARDGRVHRLTVESVGEAPGVPPGEPQPDLRAAS